MWEGTGETLPPDQTSATRRPVAEPASHREAILSVASPALKGRVKIFTNGSCHGIGVPNGSVCPVHDPSMSQPPARSSWGIGQRCRMDATQRSGPRRDISLKLSGNRDLHPTRPSRLVVDTQDAWFSEPIMSRCRGAGMGGGWRFVTEPGPQRSCDRARGVKIHGVAALILCFRNRFDAPGRSGISRRRLNCAPRDLVKFSDCADDDYPLSGPGKLRPEDEGDLPGTIGGAYGRAGPRNALHSSLDSSRDACCGRGFGRGVCRPDGHHVDTHPL